MHQCPRRVTVCCMASTVCMGDKSDNDSWGSNYYGGSTDNPQIRRPLFLRDRQPVPRPISSGNGSWCPHCQFFTTFEHQAPWGFEIFRFPTRLKILYCNPRLKKVLYKLIFALILKLYGTIRHTILKTWAAKPKNLEPPWGLVLESGTKLTVRSSATTTTRNWASGEVLALPWRRVFKKKNSGSILTCTIEASQIRRQPFKTYPGGLGLL